MNERAGAAEAHAYVDNCLSLEARRAFEARLRDDAALRRRVEIWKAQNDAIRVTFAVTPRARGPLVHPRASNENFAPRKPGEFALRVASFEQNAEAVAESREFMTLFSAVSRTRWPKRFRRWAVGLAMMIVYVAVDLFGGPGDVRTPLMEAGVAAYRAFADAEGPTLDLSTSDVGALIAWLGPSYANLARTADLRAAGWRLEGARLVPGVDGAAALILMRTPSQAQAGLIAEPLDAPPALAPRTRAFGSLIASARTDGALGLAAVGADPDVVARLLRARAPIWLP